MNKNTVILILIVATLIGSTWGSVVNRKKIDLERKLNETVANMKQLAAATAREQEQVLEKTAALQENILIKDQQIGKARKELVALRKETQALEARLSGCNAAVQEQSAEKEQCLRDLAAARKQIAATSDTGWKAGSGREQAASSGSPAEGFPQGNGPVADSGTPSNQEQQQADPAMTAALQERLDAANARIIGLEKIIIEKKGEMEAAGKEMERLRINRDVLLAKIADQQERLREMEEKNRTLNLELAARNEELVELRGEAAKQPDAAR